MPAALGQEAAAPKQYSRGDALWLTARLTLDYEAEKKSRQETLDEFKRKGFESEQPYAHQLRLFGDLEAAVGHWQEAKTLFEQSWRILDSLGVRAFDSTRLDTLNALIAVHLELAEYREARQRLAQCQQIVQKVENAKLPEAIGTQIQIAEVLLQMGDFDEAEAAYQRAIEFSQNNPSRERDTLYVHNLALLAQRRGDLDRAMTLLKQDVQEADAARKQSPQPANDFNYAHSLSTLALVEKQRGELAEAQKHYGEALAILERVAGADHSLTIRTQSNLGALHTALGKYVQAEAFLMKAAKQRKALYGGDHLDVADSLNDLARMYIAAGDVQKAAEPALEAVRITRLNVERTAAAQSERQQLAMIRQLRDRLDTLLSVGLAGGIAPDRLWAEVLEWKGSVYGRQRGIHKLWADPMAASLVAAIQDNARQASRLALCAPEASYRQQWLAKRKELDIERERLEPLLAEKLGPGADRAEGGNQDIATALAGHLPADAALIDYLEFLCRRPAASGEPPAAPVLELAAFVVRRDRPIAVVGLGPAAAVNQAVEQWRKVSFAFAEPTAAASPAVLLKQKLLAPLEAHLAGIKTLLVSPDGPVSGLPWAALPGKEPATCLLEDWAIGVIAVPRLLGELVASEPAGTAPDRSLLLVGEVDFNAIPGIPIVAAASRSATRLGAAMQWGALPATREEVVAIRDSFETAFAEGTVHSLRAGKATEEALRQAAGQHRFVHLATHGFFAPDILTKAMQATGPITDDSSRTVRGLAAIQESAVPDLLAGLVLAGANRPPASGQDDGILTALEVRQLDLSKVELATLSACQTGLGKQASGEGLIGLQRAFQVAGARTVMSSLWEVNDQATRTLMVRFYENLWKSKMGKLEALREAQLWMLKEGHTRGLVSIDDAPAGATSKRLPPYYWAAFVLSGDWR